MDSKFTSLIERLRPSFEALMACPPVRDGGLPPYGAPKGEKSKGVYLFTEDGTHLYVGRSNRLLERYKNHWMANKTEREAAFAFKLARRATGFEKASYQKGDGSRKGLAANPVFHEAFTRAKARIQAMEYRWVIEPDPTTQCLLEIYVATVLGTPFNDFDNH
jgi:hypothetical protein